MTRASAIRLCSRRRTVGGETSAATSRKSSWWNRQLSFVDGLEYPAAREFADDVVDLAAAAGRPRPIAAVRSNRLPISAAAPTTGSMFGPDRNRANNVSYKVSGTWETSRISDGCSLSLATTSSMYSGMPSHRFCTALRASGVMIRIQGEHQLVRVCVIERRHREYFGRYRRRTGACAR